MIEHLSFNIAVDITGTLGILFVALSIMSRRALREQKTRFLLFMCTTVICMLLSDYVACVYRGNPKALLPLYVSNTANYILTYILLLIFLDYITQVEGAWRQNHQRLRLALIWTALVMSFVTALNPVHQLFFSIPADTGLYVRGEYYYLHTVVASVFLICCLAEILTCPRLTPKKRFTSAWLFFNPLLLGLIQQYYPGLSLSNISALLSVYAVYSIHYAEQNITAEKTEIELQNAHSALILSQIQPHFLFNAMTTIMDLCDTEPQEAKAALQELSDYLHYKIPALSQVYVVPFSEDLEFLQNYLKLEKRRYGDRLHVEYDIGCTDFSVPLLTLQPLVENAIRHGISKRPGGGLVRISSLCRDDICIVKVLDNGVGFDSSAWTNSPPNHVGLANVKNRIRALCGGTLTIHSTPGIGTVVEIEIRKQN